ncbi:hypothetical protein [Eubacterium ramulus]
MGKSKSRKYKKTLHQQAYSHLQKMMALGESKEEAKKEGKTGDKIYSPETYKVYMKHINYFIRWIRKAHPEITSMKTARRYVNEWLQTRVDKELSAWTVQAEAAALNKYYGIARDDPKRFQCPSRKRVDIKRSRGEKVRDKHFSKQANEELIHFCQACGFRRKVLEHLRGDDLYDRARVEQKLKDAREAGDIAMIHACEDALTFFPDQDYFMIHRRDKGGKTRISPIVGPHKQDVIRRMQNTGPDELVWRYVNKNCDVHGYRADYATYLYKQYARPIEKLDYNHKFMCADGKMRSEIYICRSDESGKKLDRRAVRLVSVALGHNREDTAITSYIRNL